MKSVGSARAGWVPTYWLCGLGEACIFSKPQSPLPEKEELDLPVMLLCGLSGTRNTKQLASNKWSLLRPSSPLLEKSSTLLGKISPFMWVQPRAQMPPHSLKRSEFEFWCPGSEGKGGALPQVWAAPGTGLLPRPPGCCLSGRLLQVQGGLFIKHCRGSPCCRAPACHHRCGEGPAKNTANVGLMSPSRD